MSETKYATHCPLCGTEVDEPAQPYAEYIDCPKHGELLVEVWG